MKKKVSFIVFILGLTLGGVSQVGASNLTAMALSKNSIKSEPLKKFSTYTRKIHPSTYKKSLVRTPVDV
ncbi:MAG TPA: hypothetical protein VMW10_05455 [Alphaproteobacteria bacterium]|nr:hypothetical protein [Alphaproteobacteria bacterium]